MGFYSSLLFSKQRTESLVVQSELAGRHNECRCFVQRLFCFPLYPLD